MKNIIKISIFVLSCFLILTSSGCSKKTEKDKDLDYGEVPVKVAIITPSKKDNFKLYDMASSIVQTEHARHLNNDNFKNSVIHYSLPDEKQNVVDKSIWSSQDVEKIIKQITEDKNVKSVVVSVGDKKGMLEYMEKLKKSRPDILQISSTMGEEDKILIENMDLNFKINTNINVEKIVRISKELQSEKFIYYVEESDLINNHEIEKIEKIKQSCKKYKIEYIQIIVPENLKTYEEKTLFISNSLSQVVEKYGQYINVYPGSDYMDKVVMLRSLDLNYRIAQFFNPSCTELLVNILDIDTIERSRNRAFFIQGEITSKLRDYDMNSKISGYTQDAQKYAMYFAVEVGMDLKGKNKKTDEAYNSYYLEKLSNIRNNYYANFKTKYKGVGNFKEITMDSEIY